LKVVIVKKYAQNMRNYIFVILACLGFFASEAQQEAQYTQYMNNNLLLNPGFAGARRVASVNALYRNQWIGFKGNPRSYLASYDTPLPNINKLGVGILLANQSEGIISRLSITPSVSYAIIHTEENTLRVGISATYRQYGFNLVSPSVNIRERLDPTLSTNDVTTIRNMNVGMGIYFDKKNIYAGFSIPNLNANPLIISQSNSAKLVGKEYRHFYGMVGGLFPLNADKSLELKPSILLKYVANAPFSIDATVNVLFKKKFMGGLAYRFGNVNGDSIDFLSFFQVSDNMSLGMAYDYSLASSGIHKGSSIEMIARYDISVKASVMRNPRFFF
jgi:type IX secretion system PorP/SprF family membrane protein